MRLKRVEESLKAGRRQFEAVQEAQSGIRGHCDVYVYDLCSSGEHS